MRLLAFALLCISIHSPAAAEPRADHLARDSEQSAPSALSQPASPGLTDGAITTEKLEAFPLRSSCRLVDRPFLSSPHHNNHFSRDVPDVPALIQHCISYYLSRHLLLAEIKARSPERFRLRWGMRYDKQPSPTFLLRRLAALDLRDQYRLWRDVQTATLTVDDMLRQEGQQP